MREQQDVPLVRADVLEAPKELSAHSLRARVLVILGLVVVVVAVVTLVPGLAGLRSLLAHARPGWLALGVGLKVLSGLGYVVVFRMIFCRRMSWGVSAQIGLSELGANALFPSGGAGGLALGVWALKRGGMQGAEIARRTVAFFLLTSVPNVLGVILIGTGLAVGVLKGESNLLLSALPAAVAAGAVVATLLAGELAGRLGQRLRPDGSNPRSKRSLAAWKALTALGDGIKESLALLREGNALLIAGLFAYLVFDVMVLWATFHALGASPPLAILAMAYLIGELGGLIPLPGGIGGIDLGLVGALVLCHVSITSAAGAVLAYRAICLLVPSLLGGVAFLALRRTLREEAVRVAICAPHTEMEIIGVGRAVVEAGPP